MYRLAHRWAAWGSYLQDCGASAIMMGQRGGFPTSGVIKVHGNGRIYSLAHLWTCIPNAFISLIHPRRGTPKPLPPSNEKSVPYPGSLNILFASGLRSSRLNVCEMVSEKSLEVSMIVFTSSALGGATLYMAIHVIVMTISIPFFSAASHL